MQFTPLVDFYSEEMRSQYCVGLSYFASGSAAHAKLAALLPKWIKEGKVRAGLPDAKTEAHVAGSGKVE